MGMKNDILQGNLEVVRNHTNQRGMNEVDKKNQNFIYGR